MSTIKYRFVLTGNCGTGKTSFYKKLSNGDFEEGPKSTIVSGLKSFNLNLDIINNEGKTEKKNFLIGLNDTAGQETYLSITKNYNNL